jgi:hypothetical protein
VILVSYYFEEMVNIPKYNLVVPRGKLFSDGCKRIK